MPSSTYTTVFAEFYGQVQQLCDTRLGQKLYDVRTIQSSSDAHHLSKAMQKLHSAVDDIRSRYGSQGPDLAWNLVVPGNGHGAQASPPTSSLNRRIAELESENKELKKKIAHLDQRAIDHSWELTHANENVEKFANRLAGEYKANHRFESAADHYDFLSTVKSKELRQRRRQNDEEGARSTELLELKYTQLKGQMWLQATRYDLAENALRQALERRKKLHHDEQLRTEEAREIQLQLCTALRLQNSVSKRKEAEEHYYHESLLTHLDTKGKADRIWAIRNAFELAFVNAEQAQYSAAVEELGRVWSLRHKASSECKEYLENGIVRLWQLMVNRKAREYATNVVNIACNGQGGLPSGFLSHFKKEGELAYGRGDFERSAFYLGKAWADVSTTPKDRLQLGWLYAWSLCHLKQFPRAQRILAALLDSTGPNTSPSISEVTALLAHVYFHLRKFSEAERHARFVYTQYGTKTLLGSPAYNHADILIRVLVTYDTKQKYLEAYEVWQMIFAKASSMPPESLRHHAKVGRELAATWRKNITSRPNGSPDPKKPKEVERQAEALERMAG